MPDDTVQLLSAFDRCIRRELLPYFSSQGATYSTGLCSYDGYPGLSTLRAKEYSKIQGSFFWWIHRFATEEAILEIGFGDREFIVETTLFYPANEARFAPWELLLALEIADSQSMSGNAWVSAIGFMEQTVSSISTGTRKYWPSLSRPEPKIVDRALELRGRRLKFDQHEQRRRDREKAAVEASAAFHQKRFEHVIKLLAPYQEDEELSRSSRMMLQMALDRKA